MASEFVPYSTLPGDRGLVLALLWNLFAGDPIVRCVLSVLRRHGSRSQFSREPSRSAAWATLLAFGGGPSLRYTVELLLPIVLILLHSLARRGQAPPKITLGYCPMGHGRRCSRHDPRTTPRHSPELITGHIAEMSCRPFRWFSCGFVENRHLVDRTLRKAQNAFHRARSHRPAPSGRSVASTWIVAPVIALIALVTIVVYATRTVEVAFEACRVTSIPSTPLPLRLNFHAWVIQIPEAVDDVQIEDLGKTIDTYAGPGAPVFDFDNEARASSTTCSIGFLEHRFFFVAGPRQRPLRTISGTISRRAIRGWSFIPTPPSSSDSR